MANRSRTRDEHTYAPGAVARLVGVSEHVLRAWERRYQVVAPARTSTGTRRYRAADIDRLRRLHAATRAGHPIGQIAGYSDAELDALLAATPAAELVPLLDPILAAVERLDALEIERILGAHLAALGATSFIRAIAAPLLVEIGCRWEAGTLGVSAEHLASSVLRNLLGAQLRPTAAALRTPPILFTTPPGEPHELGALMAAVSAVAAGVNAIFLGPNLPVDEVVRTARALGAHAVALGLCDESAPGTASAIRSLRARLPAAVELWIGGGAAAGVDLPKSAERIADLRDLEGAVRRLAERSAPIRR